MTRRSFGDVLDAALDAAVGAASPARSGIGTVGLFAAPFAAWRPEVPAFSARVTTSAAPVRPMVEAPAAEPLLRPRTDVEQRAWRRLQDLGAGLQPAFSASHLKRAFRRLARQLHPDSHPTLDAPDRALLGRRFADARDAYDVLLAIGR